MELDTIRKELDKLDKSLDYIMLFRQSLAVLVGEVKEEQHLPIFQSEREEKIYNSQRLFAEQTGADTELLVNVFRELIAAAIRTEKNIGQYQSTTKENHIQVVDQELQQSNQLLSAFVACMDLAISTLYENGITNSDVLALLAKYHKNSLSIKENG